VGAGHLPIGMSNLAKIACFRIYNPKNHQKIFREKNENLENLVTLDTSILSKNLWLMSIWKPRNTTAPVPLPLAKYV
jgi:hypothetical protein